MNLTDKQIKQALEFCANCECNNEKTETECALINMSFCKNHLRKQSLDYINRLETENERLQKSIELMKGAKCVYSYDGETLEYCIQQPCPICKTVEQIKAEAIKEFAVRLKSFSRRMYPLFDEPIIDWKDIDNLVKEMVGEGG